MLNILHVIDSLEVGGAERMLVDIANATVRDEHSVSVCVTRNTITLASELNPHVELLVLDRQKRFDLKAIRRFIRFVKDKDIAILHVHGRTSFAFSVLAKGLGLPRQCKIILHDHHGSIEIDESTPHWFRLVGRHFVSEYVGVYSKLVEWARRAGISPNRTWCIPNAIDLNRLQASGHLAPALLREEFQIPQNALIGVSVAGIRFEKGTDLLIEAIRQVQTSAPFVVCVIGADRDRSFATICRAKVAQLGLQSQVIFVGERPNAVQLLYAADFALMPSRSESGPLVLIEYMAAGLPFVAFEVGDISHTTKTLGVQGFVEPNNISDFVDEISRLLTLTQNERKNRGDFGRKIVYEHFSIQAKMKQWYEVYTKVQNR